MTFVSLGEALETALSAGYFGAAGTAIEAEKATATAGTEAVVSSWTVNKAPTANGIYAARRIPTGPKASHAPARSVGIRLVVNNEVAVQRSPREGKARRTVLKLVKLVAAERAGTAGPTRS